MKFKLLLLLLFVSAGFLRAQEAYRNLIFSEVRMDEWHHTYAEITNMGDQTVNLGDFELGTITPWNDPYIPGPDSYVRLTAVDLAPGESFVIATFRDWLAEQAIINPERYDAITKKDTWKLADMQLHLREAPTDDPTDSVSVGFAALEAWNGRSCWYLRHHFVDEVTGIKDSVVVDAVNGIFTGDNGRRPNDQPSDVAGVANGTREAILVRKYNITQGTTDWEAARGTDLNDSEWLPIPRMVAGGWEINRKEYWTVGNHGNFRLDAEHVKSSTIAIDWTNKTMTVDWGGRNNDSIMVEFDYAPGLAWRYQLSPDPIDSAFTSVRTGDSLTLYAAGNQLDIMKFALILNPPTASEARVMPKNAQGDDGGWYTPYIVTTDVTPIDSILEVPYATRVDTLFKYLEKAPNASWEIVWADGVERPDLIRGDKLKVTAEDGSSTKEYYIYVEDYLPSHDAELSSITWPDIPEYLKGIFGWKGDTIPSFTQTKVNYKVQVPLDVTGIPNLIAKTNNIDAKVEVERAKNLTGSEADRTIKFHTTAEDDTSKMTYNIVLEKEKDIENQQPYVAEPFFSQIVMRENWANNFIEICNPGNQVLDLSRYVIVRGGSSPGEAITESSGVDNWGDRFRRFVPGYIWQDEAQWQEQPSVLVQDFSVNTMVDPGDVFVMGWCNPTTNSGADHPRFPEIDVNFRSEYNPWGLTFTDGQVAAFGWVNESYYLYKILNDSVLNGLKPLNDPADVQIIDVFGNCDWSDWGTVDGVATGQNSGFMRLPQYYKGNTEPGGSFGTGEAGTSEWRYTNISYWEARGYGWPWNEVQNSDGIGSHEMVTVTEYMSTIGSIEYIASEGYKGEQTIIGVKTGTTVDDFLAAIIKKDEGQVLTVSSNGTDLSGGAAVSKGDVLTVVSANGENTTQYTIDVTDQGLDNNAVLTSTTYTITVNGAQGTISGFEAGTTLRAIHDGVTVPATALYFNMLDAEGAYVALSQINFDTTYVDVLASDQIFFEVTAQDGKTKITYQLQPNSTASDAYVLSNTFEVDQDLALIKLVPEGLNVSALFDNVTPAPGASIELRNKLWQLRDFGSVYKDDKLVVTAQDGETQKTYSLMMLNDLTAAYLAVAYSDVYVVDQADQTISQVSEGTTPAAFLANISASAGATIEVQNSDGTAKTGDAMVSGDILMVTSEDGSNVTYYTVDVKVSAAKFGNSGIKMYPNPTTGMVNFDGVSDGSTIRVFNAVGLNVMTINADAMTNTASLSDQPAGIYMIVISNANQNVAKFKLIKK